MQKLSIFFTMLLISTSFSVLAHNGEHHGDQKNVSAEQASVSAHHVVIEGIKRGLIPAGWKNIDAASAEKTMADEKTQWLVRFENQNAADPTKQTLYVFLNLDGSYISANFTGKD